MRREGSLCNRIALASMGNEARACSDRGHRGGPPCSTRGTSTRRLAGALGRASCLLRLGRNRSGSSPRFLARARRPRGRWASPCPTHHRRPRRRLTRAPAVMRIRPRYPFARPARSSQLRRRKARPSSVRPLAREGLGMSDQADSDTPRCHRGASSYALFSRMAASGCVRTASRVLRAICPPMSRPWSMRPTSHRRSTSSPRSTTASPGERSRAGPSCAPRIARYIPISSVRLRSEGRSRRAPGAVVQGSRTHYAHADARTPHVNELDCTVTEVEMLAARA